MKIRSLVFALAALVASTPVWAVREVSGTTPGGAAFRIAVPDNWQPANGLVLYQHGFNFELDTSPDLGPLEPLLLQQGYAVAASGYRQRGWALFTAIEDNVELVQRFTQEFGAPASLYTFGGSMGGLISLKLAEDPRVASTMRGVYAVCPPAAGARTWDAAFDLKLAYDAVCPSAGQLPEGAQPHPWALDLDDIPADLDDPLGSSDQILDSVVPVSLCTGLNFPDSLETQGQRDRRAFLMQVAGTTDEDTLTTLLAYAIYGTADLLRSPDKMANRNPWWNGSRELDGVSSVVYPALVNESIRRVEKPDPFAALDFRRVSSLTGAGSARIVSLHTSRDEIVVPAHQRALRERYAASRVTSAIVNEPTPTHCGFEPPELVAGWELLRRWSTNAAPQPTPATLQQACQLAVANGIPGNCRITEVATAALPQNVAYARRFDPEFTLSGSWFNPARAGEGFTLESTGPTCTNPDVCNGAASWFTYPPTGDTGTQRWIIGATQPEFEQWLVMPDARLGVAGTFAGAGATTPWGRVEFEFFDDATGNVRYVGPPAYGTGVQPLQQLIRLDISRALRAMISPAPPTARVRRAGTYYDATKPGSGIVVQLEEQPTGALRAFAVWYTFDATGAPMWLVGEGTYGAGTNPSQLTFAMQRTRGPVFGNGPIGPVERTNWGSVTLEFPSGSCDARALSWQSTDPAFATGSVLLTRLTTPLSGQDTGNCTP